MQRTFNSFELGQIQRYEGAARTAPVWATDWWKIRRKVAIFLEKRGFLFLTMSAMLVLVVVKTEVLSDTEPVTNAKPIATKSVNKQRPSKQKVGNGAAAISASFKTKNSDPTEGVTEVLPTKPMQPMRSQAYATAGNDANLFDNVSIFVAPEKANATIVKTKQEKCWDYVRRFVNVARTERQKFGIPVSIILAQGLLESDAGDSRLTRSANNHFGIKTFSKSVAHVVLKDDTPTDKFKKYGTAWESYRDHSLLLMRDHYKSLQYLSKTDYAGWAKGLEKAGYATDKMYAEKLIKIIENLKLYKLDEA